MDESGSGVGMEADNESLFGEVTEAHLRSHTARGIFERCGVRIQIGPDRWSVLRSVADAIKACGQ